MGVTIQDSRSGRTAEVNAENQLSTRAVAVPSLHDKSVKFGDTYFLQFMATQTVADTETIVGSFAYTGVRQLIMSKMYASTTEKASNSNTIITLYAMPTAVTGGIAWQAMNLNTESSRTLSMDLKNPYFTASPMSASAFGNHFYSAVIGPGSPTYILDPYDCMVMKKNMTILLTMKSTSANVSAMIYYIMYEQDNMMAAQ